MVTKKMSEVAATKEKKEKLELSEFEKEEIKNLKKFTTYNAITNEELKLVQFNYYVEQGIARGNVDDYVTFIEMYKLGRKPKKDANTIQLAYTYGYKCGLTTLIHKEDLEPITTKKSKAVAMKQPTTRTTIDYTELTEEELTKLLEIKRKLNK